VENMTLLKKSTGFLFTSNVNGLRNLKVEAEIWQITRAGTIPNSTLVRGLAPSSELFEKYLLGSRVSRWSTLDRGLTPQGIDKFYINIKNPWRSISLNVSVIIGLGTNHQKYIAEGLKQHCNQRFRIMLYMI
jgi:hypothetical protein